MSSYWGLAAAPPPGTPRPEWANVWPEFDPFSGDPRFQDLLLRMNLKP